VSAIVRDEILGGQPREAASAAAPAAPVNSYDEVPYTSHPYAQATPDRLAVVATLMGMKPAGPARCRVLELGCCSGGNLLPLAVRHPESEFVGVDISARQVALGQEMIGALAIKNARIERRDILDIGQTLGQFDYIITHGVFSWVPPRVQDEILAVSAENLTAEGVAYVSYNVFPGWHMRGIIRDMMLYRASSFERPADRVRHSRALVDFLAQSVPEDNPYGSLLRRELESLRSKDDDYLFHEHLEDFNEPLYFHQFAERATRAGLQYLGEADFGTTSVSTFKPATAQMLETVAHDRIELEQYMDFLRNRMFRQTLLCRRGVAISDEPIPQRLLGLHVASSAKPENPGMDVRSKAEGVFRGRHAVTKTTDPLMKSALLYLSEIWPRAVCVHDLIAIARSRLAGDAVVVDATQITGDSLRLAEPLLRCYATSQIELTAIPSEFTLKASERPAAFRFARLQAERTTRVTNLRHESCTLDDLQRQVLRLLDGSRDRQAMLDELVRLLGEGTIIARDNGRPLEGDRVRIVLDGLLTNALHVLAREALIVAPSDGHAGR